MSEAIKEVASHGAPNPPAAEPATKAEVEAAAKAAAAAAEAKAKKPEGMDEQHNQLVEKPEGQKEVKQVTQAELDAAVEEAKKKSQEEWSGEYVSMGHEAGQAVVDLLKEANVAPATANAIFEDAIKSGDLSKVKWADLEKHLGSAKAKLAKAGIQSYYNEVYVAQQQTVAEVYKEFGGQGNWEKVRDWAQTQEKADPAFAKQVREYRKALDTGGFAALAAAKALKEAYIAAPNTKGLDNPTLEHGGKQPEVQGGPLSKDEYLKLRREAENNRASEKEIAVLAARRKAGMMRERGLA